MASLTTIAKYETIVNALIDGLLAHAQSGTTGVVNVTIDGVTTAYSIEAAKSELAFWERRLAIANGTRRTVFSIDLGST